MTGSSAKTLTLLPKGECVGALHVVNGADLHPIERVKPKLWVRTAAGPSIGFGHLKRSLVLAGLLENSLEPIFLLDGGDIGSQSQVTAQGWRFEHFRLSSLWSRLPPPDGILIDTREMEGAARLVEEARKRSIPVVSIHDLGLNPLPSDIIIDGSMLPSTDGFPRLDSAYYSGPSYLVLDPSFGLLHRRHKRIADRIGSVVVNLGGGNSGGCFVKVLEGLRLWDHMLEVVGVPGFTSWGQNALSEIDWRPLRFRWAAPDESVAQLLFRADLGVTAGGLSAFEALCTGTPLVAIGVEEFQKITIETLANADACICLGCVKTFRPVQMPEILSSIAQDRKRREWLSCRGRQIVDGRGADRVWRIIRRAVFEHVGVVSSGAVQ
jgi:UDP-2,4-diacetamido-2,4,6-trideoxy-beta-L-altropyranose hydrolase